MRTCREAPVSYLWVWDCLPSGRTGCGRCSSRSLRAPPRYVQANFSLNYKPPSAEFERQRKMEAAGVLPAKSWDGIPKWTLGPGDVDPDVAWPKLQVKRTVGTVTAQAHDSKQADGTLRIVCISDTHTTIADDFKLPHGDVLVHAGDFSNVGQPAECRKFAEWIKKQPFEHKVVIAGNHDLSFDPESYAQTRIDISRGALPEECQSAPLKEQLSGACHYLEDSEVIIEGVKFYGSPWSPRFFDWAFNADRGEPIAEIWRKIPTDTDVLVTHGPPIGHGDLCSGGNRAGCVDLLREIETRVRPVVHIFGHVHEGYGLWANPTCPTTFVNASTCTLQYRPNNPPIVFDIPKPAA
eukprot:m.96925 g.96925  ORF g.96925 m.96925 type:complete len:352 (+) comp12377_c0_seq1:1209-2264(+)